MAALDNKTATKRIKALYCNAAKGSLIGNESVLAEGLRVYGAVTVPKNGFLVNTMLKLLLRCGAQRTVHGLWSDVTSIEGVSLPLALRCAVGSASCSLSDADIAASLFVLDRMRRCGGTLALSEYESSWYSVATSLLISKCRSLSELQSVHGAVSVVAASVRGAATEREDVFVATALMTAYSKWGSVGAAESVFEGVSASKRAQRGRDGVLERAESERMWRRSERGRARFVGAPSLRQNGRRRVGRERAWRRGGD